MTKYQNKMGNEVFVRRSNDFDILISTKSPFDGKDCEMTIEGFPLEEFDAALARWKNGALIQQAFPNLNADEREFIMTGIPPEQFPGGNNA